MVPWDQNKLAINGQGLVSRVTIPPNLVSQAGKGTEMSPLKQSLDEYAWIALTTERQYSKALNHLEVSLSNHYYYLMLIGFSTSNTQCRNSRRNIKTETDQSAN